MTRRILLAAFIPVAAAVALLSIHTVARADHSASLIGLLAIDLDVQGNTATVLGPVDGCARVESGDQIDVDYIVDAVPDDRPLIGFEVLLQYNPELIEVVGVDYDLLLAAEGSYQPFAGGGLTDDLPDSDGSYRLALLDTASQSGDPEQGTPEANVERGPGVLARFTLRAKGTGVSSLAIGYDPAEHLYPLTMDTQNEIVVADKIGSASVAVGQDCAAKAAAPEIVDTPNTEAELFGGTPPPDAPAAAGGTDVNAATDGQDSGQYERAAGGPAAEEKTAQGYEGALGRSEGDKLIPCQTNAAPPSERPAATTSATESGDKLCTPTNSSSQQGLANASEGSNTGLFVGAALLGLSTAAAGGGWYMFRRSRNGLG